MPDQLDQHESRLDSLELRSLDGDKIARSTLDEIREENAELSKQLRELWQLLNVQGRMLGRMRQQSLVKRAHRQSSASSKASRRKTAKT